MSASCLVPAATAADIRPGALVVAQAAGRFRRTALERVDQRVSWERSDQAFFAAGACHVLAWVCRDLNRDRAVGVAAVRFAGEQRVFHTYATWHGWAFDHAGWNPESELLAVNAEFEGRPVERITITDSLAEFCVGTGTGCRSSTGRTRCHALVPTWIARQPPWRAGSEQPA